MEPRMKIANVVPEAYEKVIALEQYASANVDPTLYELVKLRASMINGCGFCIDMHSHDAMKAGEKPQRLFELMAWREVGCYTDKERAALALVDQVTRLGEEGVTDEVWDNAADEFSEEELANLLVAIATINVWNRVAIPTRMQPPKR
ncbi:alkyl hydroperoxide reductase AhpD [Flexivirga endophytica]|uniref:Alkyl hydroperoxide reductase AhpD n=1 Tax=Flexivirga endophytica TaxID=1849103 RepID=A0A916T264_9MICO|nr:carboxymuconolactone decarboxylase family protein [Flexivirga endophytica]GGB28470.1 alkyl hydroperoxide reductase AhpD [Flexivirga endophytica]GHB62173.1 alkyl hydroperoxide reductase AhpD [Flexivirga endophytica]